LVISFEWFLNKENELQEINLDRAVKLVGTVQKITVPNGISKNKAITRTGENENILYSTHYLRTVD
jgi:hypothetical protein